MTARGWPDTLDRRSFAVNVPGLPVRQVRMEQVRGGHEVLPLARPSAATDRELAFGALVERALPRSYRLARVILGDPAEAEDATHDAFELAWKRWHTLRDPDLVDAWFGRIVVNVCRDRLRRRRRHQVKDLSTDVVASMAARDESSRTADRDEIGRAMSRLNPDQQVAIALRFYADLTVEEIAVRVGVPPGTVKSRLHHAMTTLHRVLAAGRSIR